MGRNTVRVIPLGGLGEVCKNITVVENDDDMILIDCGLTFPREGEGMFGVDIVLPDLSYVVERQHKLRAVVLTHGHEDHIGALPYLMRQVPVPAVYATRFTLALVKSRSDEHGLINETEWIELNPEADDPLPIASFELEFPRVAHSIPDCVAIAVHTSEGTILHSGDMKLDPTPLDGVPTDLGYFAELGSDGVDLYLADSTNADIPGHNVSERALSGPLRDIVFRATGRVIAACFSSHIHRIQQLINIAHESNRAMCVLGRSMTRNTNIARNLGYLDGRDVEFIKPQRIREFAPERLLVVCTGSQGEPLAAMNRISQGTHPHVDPMEEDTVIFSSRTIPGNEVRVHQLINRLSRQGAHIFHQDNARVHVSGHGASEELKTMLQLVRPSYFMPIHGEWRHLRAHGELAEMLGVPSDRILLADNGRVIELKNHRARLSDETVKVGHTLVDRYNNEDIVDEIMVDRQQASGEGLLVVVARMPHIGTHRLEVISRGFSTSDDDVLDDVRAAAEKALERLDHNGGLRPDELQAVLHEAVSSAVQDSGRRNPLIVPVVMED